MTRNLNYVLVLALSLVVAANNQSILLKTQEYSFQFGRVAGLNYPEFIHIQQNPNSTFSMLIYNMTSSQVVHEPIVFAKSFPSTCQFALETVDYGYYTKFPFYRVIGECVNQTHTQVYNIRVYRSGYFIVNQGNVVQKSADQLNCQLGPLRVQYFYSAIGTADTFVYRFCTKKNNSSQSLYKEFIADTRSSYIFKEQSIQKIVGLSNISLYDMQPFLGIDGKYNVYLSQTYGIIINGGSKFIQSTFRPSEKIYRVEKLCWSNSLAVLVEGYIYFITPIFYANQTITIAQTRKTEKINIDTTSKCSFFVIGHNAVCSIYNETADQTTWYIYAQDTSKIRTNATQVFKGKVTPYLSEDLCSTNSFYIKNSRYQLYFPPQLKTPQVENGNIKSRPMAVNGKPIDFIDTGKILVTSLSPANATHQNLYYAAFDKSNYGSALYLNNSLVSINATGFKLDYLYFNELNRYAAIFYVDKVNALNKSNCVFLTAYAQPPYFTFYNRYTFDIGYSELGYFKFGGTFATYQLILKTPLQTNAYGRYTFSTNQLRYPYQFEAEGFKVCSMTNYDNQMLFYRITTNQNLVVMRAGLRNLNYLVLDDVKQFPDYKYYNVECSHYGLFLYSTNNNRVIVLNGDLQVMASLTLDFQEIKFTRTLILVKKGGFVEVRTQATGDLIGLYKWQMSDLLTNLHSSGFINTKQSVYYEFGNDKMEVSTEINWKSKESHTNLKVE